MHCYLLKCAYHIKGVPNSLKPLVDLYVREEIKTKKNETHGEQQKSCVCERESLGSMTSCIPSPTSCLSAVSFLHISSKQARSKDGNVFLPDGYCPTKPMPH